MNALATWSTVSFCGDRERHREDQLGGPRRDHHTPDDDARARPREELHEAVRQVLHLGPSVGRQRQHDGLGIHRALANLLLGVADRRDLGVGEDVGRHRLEVDRRDRVTEGVPHRDPALHGRDRSQREQPGAVAGGVDAADPGPRDPVDLDVAGRRSAPRRPSPGRCPPVLGTDPTASRQWLPSTERPSSSVDHDTRTIGGTPHGGRPRAVEHLHAAPAEHVLDHLGGVGVLARQDPVAAGDERRPGSPGPGSRGRARRPSRRSPRRSAARAAPAGRRSAARSGSARRPAARSPWSAARRRWRSGRRRRPAAPRPAALRRRRRQLTSTASRLDEASAGSSRPRPRTTVTPSRLSRRAMSSLWAAASALIWRVDLGQVRHAQRSEPAAGALLLDVPGPGVRRRDQCLAGHAVGEDAGPAQPVAVDHGDVGAQLGRDQCRLVAPGAAAEDRHPLPSRAHRTIQPAVHRQGDQRAPPRQLRCGPWRCTRRMPSVSIRVGCPNVLPTRPCTAAAG